MKHSSSSNLNIYNSKRKRGNSRRRNFVVVCLFICMLCVILDVVLVTKLLGKNKKPAKVTDPSEVMTDESGNVISDPSSDSSDPSSATSETTPRVQTVDAETRAANLAATNTNIADYLGKQSGRYAMYYINMSNGETMSYKADSPMVAASSIKIAFNTYLYEKVEAGEITLDEKMAYNAAPYPNGDLETGTGTIQNSADGTEYSLQEVSHLSITISDNCATNMILRRLGGSDAVNNDYLRPISCVVDYRASVSYTDYTGATSSGKNRTSATDLAKYAAHLYEDFSNNPTVYQPLIDDLSNTAYNWGVPGGVPSTVQVAHKVGFNPDYGAYNDVAIVFASEDYALCVMCESGSEAKSHEIIAEVSRMVYEYVESNYA